MERLVICVVTPRIFKMDTQKYDEVEGVAFLKPSIFSIYMLNFKGVLSVINHQGNQHVVGICFA